MTRLMGRTSMDMLSKNGTRAFPSFNSWPLFVVRALLREPEGLYERTGSRMV